MCVVLNQTKGLFYIVWHETSELKSEKSGATLKSIKAEVVRLSHEAPLSSSSEISAEQSRNPHIHLWTTYAVELTPRRKRETSVFCHTILFLGSMCSMCSLDERHRVKQWVWQIATAVSRNGKYPIFCPRLTTHGRLPSFRLCCACVHSRYVDIKPTQARLFSPQRQSRSSRWGAEIIICFGFDLCLHSFSTIMTTLPHQTHTCTSWGSHTLEFKKLFF